MGPTIDRPDHEETWAKRLRTTKSRSVRVAQGHHKADRLPSPKPTNPSSTDNAHFSSSSADCRPKQKPNPLESLRERLKTPKKPEPCPASESSKRPANGKPGSKPSVVPFFRRIEAAFQDKPATAAPNTTHTIVSASKRPARTPSPDAEDLIQQLKEHYLRSATTLHSRATAHLAQVHASLGARLAQQLAQPDEAFLRQTDAHLRALAQPLGSFRIRSRHRRQRQRRQQRRQQLQQDGAVVRGEEEEMEEEEEEENSVGELVARAEAQVRAFERDAAALWREWAALGGGGGGGGDEASDGQQRDGDGEGEELLKRFGEVVQREIEAAEAEVVELGEEAVATMKGIEKDFRKATLPDLHIFFQSIDEP
ncbi:26aad05a-d100-423e-bcd9-2d100216fc06 [Thermothielavioides terrestris]|uniref:26aad05a-d100-423e-bcd9-2d100216fc06 n=1 Tax=Thermothielavioides terrestris TaxID=2587410 RepID=A0A3S4EWG5_9PEZI|nr:26aad05a-d100-423e-bcd9-2d100216fc06 [Thermothielavioides terrestris]